MGLRLQARTRVGRRAQHGFLQTAGLALMFCRYCGAHIAEDSLFCSKCGKRLGKRSHPRIEKTVRVLRLNTPYPYFALMLLLFASYMIGSRKTRVDYSHLKLTMEAQRNLDRRED